MLLKLLCTCSKTKLRRKCVWNIIFWGLLTTPSLLLDRFRFLRVQLSTRAWDSATAVGSLMLFPPRWRFTKVLFFLRAWARAWPPSSPMRLSLRLRDTRVVFLDRACASAWAPGPLMWLLQMTSLFSWLRFRSFPMARAPRSLMWLCEKSSSCRDGWSSSWLTSRQHFSSSTLLRWILKTWCKKWQFNNLMK